MAGAFGELQFLKAVVDDTAAVDYPKLSGNYYLVLLLACVLVWQSG
jgi:hypothetical protein